MTKDYDNQPAETVRDGNLKATIWQNEGEKGPYHTVSLAKTYQDKEGHLRDTQSFGSGDLLRVAELARTAYHRSNELRRELHHGHDQESSPDQDHERAQRRAAHRGRRSQGGGGGRLAERHRKISHDRDDPWPSL